jgi:hypothetical protein
MNTETTYMTPREVSLKSILTSNKVTHKGMTGLASSDLADMEQWLKQATRPALGTSILTPEQRKLSRCLKLITRSKRLVEAIEQTGEKI